MPKGWFFAIHEDSPEEEAANIMAHNTGVLDISSDDDCMTKKRNEERERGKENIPPPDHDVSRLLLWRVFVDGKEPSLWHGLFRAG